MPRLTTFIDNLVCPLIKESQQEAQSETQDNQCPYGERFEAELTPAFGTALNLALGDGAVPDNPRADIDLLTVTFEADIKGPIDPDPDIIINLRLRIDLDHNNPNPSLTCRLLTDEGDTTLFERTEGQTALQNPRGFIHSTISAYKDQQYQEKLEKIKAQVAENELKLNRLF